MEAHFIVLISAFRKKSADFILARQPSIWTTLCSRKHGGDGRGVTLGGGLTFMRMIAKRQLEFLGQENMIDVHLASLKA